MTEESKTQFKTEGQPAFPVADTENDDSASSSEGEETNGDQTQSQEGDQNSGGSKDDTEDKNLADHPRWKEREEDWKKRFNDQEKRHTDEIAKLREEFGGKTQQKGDDDQTPVQIPSWFGGDENEWKAFKSWNDQQLAQAEARGAEKAQKAIDQRSEEEQKKIDEATSFFNDEVTAIESDKTLNPQGAKVDRNKLLKFVLDNELVDTKGRWNYRAGWQLMQANVKTSKAPSTDEKKKVAAATTSDKHSETQPPAFMTSADFSKPGNRPW